jgi:hypothetical protein
MRKLLLTLALLFAVASAGHAQKVAVKTNALGWLSAVTTNVGVEVALWPKLTLAADGYYNPITNWGQRRSTEMWAVQPELKYWFCTKFYGSYIGLHGQYSEYDAGLFKYRYEGSYYGVGLSYGYSLPIGYRWRLDFSLGAGWKHWADYGGSGHRQVYYRVGTEGIHDPGSDWDNKEIAKDPRPKNNFGITKASVSIAFIIR